MTNAGWEEQHWNKPSGSTGKRVSSHVTWVTILPLSNKQTKYRTTEHKPDTILVELPNTVHTCSRHCVVAATLTSERTGSFIPLSKTYVHNHTFSRCVCFWNGQKNVWWRVRSASHLDNFYLHTRANTEQVICSLLHHSHVTTGHWWHNSRETQRNQ